MPSCLNAFVPSPTLLPFSPFRRKFTPVINDSLRQSLKPGVRVTVTQQIAARDYSWSCPVTGSIVSYVQEPTGSWFAHGKNDKLWLDRLTLRKPDGELTTLILDEFTHLEILPALPAVA